MKILKHLRNNLFTYMMKAVFYLVSLLPQKKKTVVFESFHGKQYSDNPRAIYEYLQKHHPEYELIWSVDRRYTKYFSQLGIKYIKKLSIRWFLLLPRAKYWVFNTRMPNWIPKPKNTVYLQTWHGTPLKKLGVDIEQVRMPGTNTEKYKTNFLNESKKWDFLISPNAYSTEIFQRAFGFNNTIIESGYPRNDFLINANNEETINKIKSSNNLPLNKKIILYAPTWRDNQYYSVGKYKFTLQLDLDLMKKHLGEDYIIIVRLHYLIADNLDLKQYEGFVYDFSRHADIRELYLISDLLITDYSSVFFDYANLHRPIIFFVYDIEDYRDQLRGFYFDIEKKAPGPLVKTTSEVIDQIRRLEKEGIQNSHIFQQFYKKFCYLEDGKATERVVKQVFLQED